MKPKFTSLSMIVFVALLLAGSVADAGILATPGPHEIWAGDTLKTSITLTDADYIRLTDYNRVHVWIKATNPADSTKFRLHYKTAFAMADAFATPGDTSGTADNTIIRVADTLWHYVSIQVPRIPYAVLYLTGGTGTGGDGHGTRCRVWVKIYLTKDE